MLSISNRHIIVVYLFVIVTHSVFLEEYNLLNQQSLPLLFQNDTSIIQFSADLITSSPESSSPSTVITFKNGNHSTIFAADSFWSCLNKLVIFVIFNVLFVFQLHRIHCIRIGINWIFRLLIPTGIYHSYFV